MKTVKQGKKIAKAELFTDETGVYCRVMIKSWFFDLNDHYSSVRSAIRGAKRFCKEIGYECEILK